MAKQLRVKVQHVGKIRLTNEFRSVVLTETTEQAILADFYGDENARQYLEEVAEETVKPSTTTK